MIRQASLQDIDIVAELALRLWPHHSLKSLRSEFTEVLSSDNCAVFVYEIEAGTIIAFAQCQLRSDYVEGTETSPVGYLEGIYVEEDQRYRGIGKKLLLSCEQWSRSRGCSEFASDCELANTASFRFHVKFGFEEAGRNIHFTKKL